MEQNSTPLRNELEIKTPKGYMIKLKRKYLLWGEKKEIKNILSQAFKMQGISLKEIEATKGKAVEDALVQLDPSINDKAQERVFDLLVEGIITPSGEHIASNFMQWLYMQSEDVGEDIFQCFNTSTQSVLNTQPSGEKNSGPF